MTVRFPAAGLAAAFLAAVPAAAIAQPVAQAAPQQQDKAAALAQIMGGPAILLPVELVFGKKSLEVGFAAEDEALLKEHPGLIDHIWAAVEPEYRRASLAKNPALVASLAAMYRQRLTPKEIDGLHAFFGGASGQKLLRGFTAVLEAADPQSVSPPENALGPEDELAMRALMASIDQAKFQAVSAEVQKLTYAHWALEDPVADARMEALIEAALKDYMDKQDNGG